MLHISEYDALGGNSQGGRRSNKGNERKPKSVCNLTIEKEIESNVHNEFQENRGRSGVSIVNA